VGSPEVSATVWQGYYVPPWHGGGRGKGSGAGQGLLDFGVVVNESF